MRDEPRLLTERLAVLHQQLPFVYSATVVVSVILTVYLHYDAANPFIAPWLAAILALTALRVASFVWSRRHLGDPQKSPLIARVYFAGSLAAGCLWGSLGIIGFEITDLTRLVVITTILSGMTAGSVASLSAHLPTYYAYAIPAMTPLIARLLTAGEDTHASFILATAGIVFLAVNLGYSRMYQKTLTDSIQLRFENEKLIEDLSAEKRRVEAASKAKSRFFATISHDLRQPVHAIALLNDGLMREAGSGAVAQIGRGIAMSLDSLDDLLSGFLDISKIEAGVVKPQIGVYPLQAIFDRLRSEFEPQAARKGLRLMVAPTRAQVRSDPVLLTRILRNLLFNAVRYTQRGGVLIGARRATGADGAVLCRIAVYDTGVGIVPERQHLVFDEFHAVHDKADAGGGAGLGLAIARGLARALGADVALRSQAGRGSAFWLDVPHGAPAPAPPRAAAVAGQADDLRGRLILVVDDDATIRAAMSDVIESWGCRVLSAATAAEALAAVAGRRPDVALLDNRLPDGQSGGRLLAALDAALDAPVPAAIISGDTALQLATSDVSPDRAAPCLVLHKPVQPARLKMVLMTLLSRGG